MKIKKFSEINEERKWKFSFEKEKDEYQSCTLCGSPDNVYAASAIKTSNSATLNICSECISEMNKKIKK